MTGGKNRRNRSPMIFTWGNRELIASSGGRRQAGRAYRVPSTCLAESQAASPSVTSPEMVAAALPTCPVLSPFNGPVRHHEHSIHPNHPLLYELVWKRTLEFQSACC